MIARRICFLFFLLLTAQLVEGTNVCGTIAANTTWNLAGSPYVVTCLVTVASAATLTIDPGVTVKFTSANRLDITGRLMAVGTAASPIVFTSNQTTPTAGYWQCLNFGAGANPSASQMAYATIAYGGSSASFPGNIHINGSSPTFSNITVSNSSKNGVFVTGAAAAPSITNSTLTLNGISGVNISSGAQLTVSATAITNNSDYAIGAEANTGLIGLTGLTLTGNGGGAKNGIGYRGGFITASETWRAGPTWIMIATPKITGTLTIQPGTIVKFPSSVGLEVSGKLTAIGTSSNLIAFTSNAATPAPGNWSCIKFNSTANPASQISYASISYAGQSSGALAALYINNVSPTISNVTISNSGQSGVVVSGGAAAPTIQNSTISNNALFGVNAINLGGFTLTSSTISGNGDYAIGAEANTRLLGLSGLTVTGNGGGQKNSIGYRGGTITTNEVWRPPLNWIITATTTINSGNSLTVTPGVTAKFASATGIEVSGKLSAIGTSTSPIQFTSNATTPAPGNWNFIKFNSGSDPTSQISYATVSFAGQSSATPAAIHISNSSPTLSNITVSKSARSGVMVSGSSANPSVTNATVLNNSLFGVNVTSAGGINLSGSTIKDNADYAIGADANTRLLGLAALSLSGNGGGAKNAVGYRPGTGINTAEVWRGGVPDWVMTGSPTIHAAGSLTIEPGVRVKFGTGAAMNVYGKLVAIGTSAAPINFTSNAVSPVSGSWAGIQFNSGSSALSQLAYAIVSYAGSNPVTNSAIYIDGSSPQFDHLTIANSSGYGMGVNGTSAMLIKNSAFLGNVSGLVNLNTSNIITARLNYWNASDGPTGSGPGTGQSITAGLAFEPWLKSAPTAPHFFASFKHLNRIFNPSINVFTTLQFTTSLSGNWTTQIFNSSNQVIRTFTGSGISAAPLWDGRNSSGVLQPNGTYRYELQSVTTGGQIAAVVRGICIIDNSKQLQLTSFAVNPPFFSPNGDGAQDTANITADFSFDDATWTLQIKNSLDTILRTVTGQGPVSYSWDGKNTSGVLQSDAQYTAHLSVAAGNSSFTDSKTFTLDNTFPTANVTSPTPNQSLSNIYQTGSSNVALTGTIGDTNLNNWTVEYGPGSAPMTWNHLASGNVAITNGTIAMWNTGLLTNGIYSIRLKVWDKAGNLTTPPQITVTLGNFSVSQNVFQINTALGQSVTYTSIVPFAVTETLQIKDQAGQIVKTLFSGSRNAGTFNDTWNGINQSGSALVPDHVYKYIATIQSGSYSMTWDLSSQFLDPNKEFLYPSFSGQNPFNNDPPTIVSSYPLSLPGKVSLLCSPQVDCSADPCYVMVSEDCTPPTACLMLDEYLPSGIPHTIQWAGTDNTGAFRPDLRGCTLFRQGNTFARNEVLLYGRRPKVTNVRVTPPLYGPDKGNQAVSFVLSTFQNQPASVSITFLNQKSLTVLRTVTQVGVAPGNITIAWDGKADNGMRVAPGAYTVTVTATTATGQSKTQILTKIQY